MTKIKGVVAAFVIIIITGMILTGLSVQQERETWGDEQQQLEEQVQEGIQLYLVSYNQDNPDEQITVKSGEEFQAFNEYNDELYAWEDDLSQFNNLGHNYILYNNQVSTYNTTLTNTFIGGVRRLFGTGMKPYLNIPV